AVLAVAVLLEHRRVGLVELDARHDGAVERRRPAAAYLADDHVGRDELGRRRLDVPAGARAQVADALARRLDLRRRALEEAGQAGDVVLRQAIEVVGDDRPRDLALLGVFDRRQLQQQALGDVARADAGRVAWLQALQ